jgi:transcriptional regulator with XRE-family HTH domain
MLADTNLIIDAFNPAGLAKLLAQRVRSRRLAGELSQAALSRHSGVSLGSLKRFETTGEISLKHLLMLAVALGAGGEFINLFPERPYQNLDDLLTQQTKPFRKRGRKNI